MIGAGIFFSKLGIVSVLSFFNWACTSFAIWIRQMIKVSTESIVLGLQGWKIGFDFVQISLDLSN